MDKKDKRKPLIILAVLIIAGIIAYYLSVPSIRFTDKSHVLEKNETYYAKDMIAEINGELETENEKLFTDKTGDYDFHYTVRKGPFSKDVVYHYVVVDTTPPKLQAKEEVISIDQGEKYDEEDMKKNIVVDEGALSFTSDLDTTFPGDYLVKVSATDDAENTSEISYTVNVKDNEPPIVFVTGDGVEIVRGNKFDLNDVISYGDNADPDPLLEVEGTVNVNKIGKYPLHLKLSDASGNVTEWDLTARVVNKRSSDDYEGEEPYEFADFVNDQAGINRIFGIDVSEWQGDINFEELKNAGCEFIMLRIGFSRNGELIIDKSFKDNLAGAKSVGMPVGVYYYSHDSNEEEVKKVFRQIVSELGDTQLELPVVFDWENFAEFQYYGISFKDLDHLYEVFKKEAEAKGFSAMLYGSKYYLENIWEHTDSRKIWMAHYTDKSSYQGPYMMWQTCAWGRIGGVEENVDFDIMFKDQLISE